MSKSAETTGDQIHDTVRSSANQLRLQFYFATLSCLGGLVLATGDGAEHIPAIAVFFSIFGFVFVDWLKLFALPPVAAYTLMGLAAVYCVGDFWKLDTPGNQQMLSVAQLLVFVQAILMLQKKTPRIFEQLGVFCLLELVVAAVFNDAFIYGLLLLPIGMIGIWALVLLSSVTACDDLDSREQASLRQQRGALERNAGEAVSSGSQRRSLKQRAEIRVSADDSVASLTAGASGMERYAMITLGPAVLLVAAFFFYAIPRTTDAARMENRGDAIVGFSDQVRLDQIGQMMKSSTPALRVRLTDRKSGRPYVVNGGIYLRGQVLERYEQQQGSQKRTATWKSVPAGVRSRLIPLPNEFIPQRRSDLNFYDSVVVDVTCESTTSRSLFSIAPHFRTKTETDVLHSGVRWLLSRRENSDFFYPRIRYQFGTHAFHEGVQTDLLAENFQAPRASFLGRQPTFDPQVDARFQAYLRLVRSFDPASMPTVAGLANEIKNSIPANLRTDLNVAEAMELHLAVSGGYEYTLNLDAEPIPGVDPIEQFMSVDRRGHCQYFASALAMMLRSVNVPARIVVGYHTDDFEQIGQHYVARQSDAHAWVEALISRDQLGPDRLVYGQPRSDFFWVRLDPTPGGGGIPATSTRRVDQVLDLARDLWEEYVVDMDGDRQQRVLSGGQGNAMNQPYESLLGWFRRTIDNIRGGELGGGSLALREVFSWPALLAGIIAMVLMLALKLRIPRWPGRRSNRPAALATERPAIWFYVEMLRQLQRLGITRSAAQTPTEFLQDTRSRLGPAADSTTGEPEIVESLRFLTAEFCRERYGLHRVSSSGVSSSGVSSSDVSSSDVSKALSRLTGQVDELVVTSAGDLTPQSMEQPR